MDVYSSNKVLTINTSTLQNTKGDVSCKVKAALFHSIKVYDPECDFFAKLTYNQILNFFFASKC